MARPLSVLIAFDLEPVVHTLTEFTRSFGGICSGACSPSYIIFYGLVPSGVCGLGHHSQRTPSSAWLFQLLLGLEKVDDMDTLTLAENVRRHFGIPFLAQVAKVDTGVQHFLIGWSLHVLRILLLAD